MIIKKAANRERVKSEKNKLSQGFTLVELLIVIAVIGVLAAIVLVAINPIEQIARGRDASAIQGAGQLARAQVNAATAQSSSTYPASAANFQTGLITSGDITNRLTAPAGTVQCGSAATFQDTSLYCYKQLNAGADFAIWVNLQSQSEKTKAGNCATNAVAVFFASKGKVQLDCVATATTDPQTTDTLYNP